METRLFGVTDGSYSMESFSEGMKHSCGRALANRKFKILAENCTLPGEDSSGVPVENNTIIYDIDNKKVVFIQRRLLKPIKTFCPCCGKPSD